jgi:hypothetical protein
MRWPPHYQKIVIEAGDEYAIHSGGKGGIQMSPPSFHSSDEAPIDDLLEGSYDDERTTMEFLADPSDVPTPHRPAPGTAPEPAAPPAQDDPAIELSDDLLRPWQKYLDRPAPDALNE